MPGYWSNRFAALADIAGVEGPPHGALRPYAEDLLSGVLSAARSACSDDDHERGEAIGEMERLALTVIEADGEEKLNRAHQRAARTRDRTAPAAPPTTARPSVRARYRGRTTS